MLQPNPVLEWIDEDRFLTICVCGETRSMHAVKHSGDRFSVRKHEAKLRQARARF